MEQKNRPTGVAVIVWYVLVVFLPIAGLAGLVPSLLPYPGLKSFFDHLAKDGNFERFTPRVYQTFHLPVLIAASLLLLACGLAVWKARYSQAWVVSCLRFLKSRLTRLFQDIPGSPY